MVPNKQTNLKKNQDSACNHFLYLVEKVRSMPHLFQKRDLCVQNKVPIMADGKDLKWRMIETNPLKLRCHFLSCGFKSTININ